MTKELFQQAINASRTEVDLQMSLHQFAIEVSQLHEEHGNSQQYDDMLGVKTEQFFDDYLKALAQQEPNPWAEAVIDQLVTHFIYVKEHDKDPRKAVKDLLASSNQIALDPQASSDAQALIDRGRKEAQQEQPASVDAYVGAREDAAIWKKRALEAEELNRKFIAEVNGPTYLGEPAQPAQDPCSVRITWTKLGTKFTDFFDFDNPTSPIARDGTWRQGHWNARHLRQGNTGAKLVKLESVTMLYTHPAPTQPALTNPDIVNFIQAAGFKTWDSRFFALCNSVAAHCLGGANG